MNREVRSENQKNVAMKRNKREIVQSTLQTKLFDQTELDCSQKTFITKM